MSTCGCGCRKDAGVYAGTHHDRGQVKGMPRRFIPYHAVRRRGPDYKVIDNGYSTPCWVWQRSLRPSGYGQVNDKGKTKGAHRWMYEKRHGPISEGLHLDHLCKEKRCVNPDHLQSVPGVINAQRAIKRRWGRVCPCCKRPF